MGNVLSAHYTPMRQDLANKKRGVLATPTITAMRMRIAETRIRQFRVAARLDISDGHLSHILAGRKSADAEMLARIAQAIEDVASEQVA